MKVQINKIQFFFEELSSINVDLNVDIHFKMITREEAQ